MPIIRVQIPLGHTDETKRKLRDGIRQAIVEAIDPGQQGRFPETERWIYVSITEAFGDLGAGLPTVTIDTRPGRKREQKDALTRLVSDVFAEHLKTRDVYLLFRETPAADHMGGTEPLPDWTPD
ncbi:MAG: tautomerase family protein [Alphaproteobacteria bacterium]